MAILGFIACFIVLLYVLAACIVGFFGVSFAIGMGGGRQVDYVFPLAGLIIDLWLFWLLFRHCPFTITIS